MSGPTTVYKVPAYKRAGDARISVERMNQAALLEMTSGLPGWRVANKFELSAMAQTNRKVRQLLEDWVITDEVSLQADGPFERLEGEFRMLWERHWTRIGTEVDRDIKTDRTPEKVLEEYNALPMEDRGWATPGSGLVRVIIMHGDGGLAVNANTELGDTGYVVWVKDSKPQPKPIAEQLRQTDAPG